MNSLRALTPSIFLEVNTSFLAFEYAFIMLEHESAERKQKSGCELAKK